MDNTPETINDAVWFLVGQGNENESVHYVAIHSTPFQIGRRGDLSFTLQTGTVSGLHAEVVQEGSVLIIRDLNSTNGTYVNGRRITNQTEIKENDLVQFADVAFRLRRQASYAEAGTIQTNGYDRALALVQFDNLMRDRSVVPHYQPIVDLEKNKRPIGYEVLGRSNLIGLETPRAMFIAAAQLNVEVELSRMFRWEGVKCSVSFPDRPNLFLNTHPEEMKSPGLLASMQSLRDFSATQPITLEIHEKAVTDPVVMNELRSALKDLDIQLAYDDFGCGQTRLVELVEVRPDFLKFDMALIRDIDKSAKERQQMLATLVRMTRELGIATLAEGVETEGEHHVCRQMGFQLGQGFYYGKPAAANLYDVPSPATITPSVAAAGA